MSTFIVVLLFLLFLSIFEPFFGGVLALVLGIMFWIGGSTGIAFLGGIIFMFGVAIILVRLSAM